MVTFFGRVTQSEECKAVNLKVVGSKPTVSVNNSIYNISTNFINNILLNDNYFKVEMKRNKYYSILIYNEKTK